MNVVMTLVPQEFNAVNVFKSAKERNTALTWIPAPPEGPLSATFNMVGEEITPVKTPMNTKTAFRCSVSGREKVITKKYQSSG